MSHKIVDGIFIWPYTKSNFKAIFGRFNDDNSYSKDFLQCPSAIWPALDNLLGRGDDAQITIRFKWPDGEIGGKWRLAYKQDGSVDRGRLYWESMNNSPAPWRMGDPINDPVVTIPGNPAAQSPTDANAEYDKIADDGINPWLVAVKVRGEGPVLHLRVYLGNPPAGLEKRGVTHLPKRIRDAIENLAQDESIAIDLTQGVLPRAPELVDRIFEALRQDPNVLLVGPPGTGKTVALEDIRAIFEHNGRTIMFDPDQWDNAWQTPLDEQTTETKVIPTVFHPSYTYENFVAGLFPAPAPMGQGIHLEAQPGPLLSLAHWAGAAGRRGLLIIDEFNRGAAASIFGDTLALLDGTKRDTSFLPGGTSGASILRPFVRNAMEVAEDFRHPLRGLGVPPNVSLPSTLWILAALNSTDRSVAPLDAALRRRFAILQVPPDYSVLARHLGLQADPTAGAQPPFTPSDPEPANWQPEDVSNLAVQLLKALNERIALVLGQDFLLGHALLWGVCGDAAAQRAIALAKAFDERIVATLRLTFVDQDEALAAVLKAGRMPAPGAAANGPGATQLVGWRAPTQELEAVAGPRIVVRDAALMPWPDALRALQALL